MHALSWHAERAFLKAWPALSTVTRHGWQARFSNGVSRRSNSVNPLAADAWLDRADVRFFESFYRAKNLPLIFRVPTLIEAEVDDILEKSGFIQEGECCVLHGALDALTTSWDVDVEIEAAPNREWFDAIHNAQDRAPEQRAIYEAVINDVSLLAGFAMLRENGEAVALVYAALDGDLLCIESVVTAPAQRGKGHARRLIAALLHWAKAKGATAACLQVEISNASALALYRRIGLGSELYRYHYRRQKPI